MAPVVDRLTGQYEGRVEISRMNVETDERAAALASTFGVQYVPTFVFTDSDGTVIDTIVGEVSEADLTAALDALD